MFNKSFFIRKIFLLSSIVFLSLLISTNFVSATIPNFKEKNYFTGDAHIHTEYDLLRHSGSFDSRSSIKDQANAAKKAGLDWMIVTDHSDVVTKIGIPLGYMTKEGWEYQQSQIEEILDFPVYLGEEITMGNGVDLRTRGHFLAYGIRGFIPTIDSLFDEKRPKAEYLIKRVAEEEGFGFIAHPYRFDTFLLDAEPWTVWRLLNPYSNVIRGIELLHDGHDAPTATLNAWDSRLQKGKHFWGIGNSDAHSSWGPGPQPGETFTYLNLPEGLNEKEIYSALKNGRAIASTGPFVTLSINGIGPGGTVKAQPGDILTLEISWESNSNYGELEKIELFDQGTKAKGEPEPFETLKEEPGVSGSSGTTTYNYEVLGEGFLRLRGETTEGKVAYTNPIFISLPEVYLHVREEPLVVLPGHQSSPAISGNKVVFESYLYGYGTYVKDLVTEKLTPLTTNLSTQHELAISGDKVVWRDDRNREWDIYMKNLSTGEEAPVNSNYGRDGGQWKPDIDENIVVWEDLRNGNLDIYMKNLSTGEEKPVTTNLAEQYDPAISGDIVVWEDTRNGDSDIYMKNLTTGKETPITTNSSDQLFPAIDGNIIVWEDWRNGNPDIYMKDLSTGKESAVTTYSSYQQNPDISGEKVVWEDYRHGSSRIYLKDLSLGIEMTASKNPSDQLSPAISRNKIVWEDYRSRDWNIYLARVYRQTSLSSSSDKEASRQASQALTQSTQSVTITPEMLQATLEVRFQKGTDLTLTLIGPDGKEITPSTPETDYDISYTQEENRAYYQIDNPLPGEWQVKIEAGDPQQEAEVFAYAVVETPPEVTLENPQDGDIVKGSINISAQAKDDEEVTDFDLSLNGKPVAVSQDNKTLSYSWDTTTTKDGYYQLSAIASDPKLTFGQADALVVVDNVLPEADAGEDQKTNPGIEVTFDGSASTDVTEFGYTWDFGDGEKQEYTGSQVTHTYPEAGNYTVTLTVQDAAGNTATDTTTITVVKPEFSMAMQKVYWASYQDWQNRHLSVDFELTNTGEGDALNTEIKDITATNEVTIITPQPISLETIAASTSKTFTVKYQIPNGVRRFRTILHVSCEDEGGNVYYY